MVPADTNAFVAQYTTDELLHNVPAFLGMKAAAEKMVVCTLEERVRIAMKCACVLSFAPITQAYHLVPFLGSQPNQNG